jgi:hypothetical protein
MITVDVGSIKSFPKRNNDFNGTIYVKNSRENLPIKIMGIWLDYHLRGRNVT